MKRTNQIPNLKKQKKNKPCKKYRLFYKDDTSTMLFTKDITENTAIVLESMIKDVLSKHDCTLKGKFIIVQ